jgi:hypothetical protein
MKKSISNPFIWCLVLLTVAPVWAVSSEPNTSPVFKQEELDQILAPIALYPDSLLSQVLMASTYPLEIVQADRWAKQNKDISDDAAAALEKETWDPSVKSLVNFPQVLTMMSEKLDWTQKLGDAFLAQQKDVMDTVQGLRKKAEDQGNLKTTEEQVVKNDQDTIIIQPADPQVVYVPTYDPAVIYGTWPYHAYPPYYYYPHGYVAGVTPYSFGVGVVAGAAWGYAWGSPDWHGSSVNVDVSRNLNLNQNINRSQYTQHYQNMGQFNQSGQGKWQHNPADRKGVAYRDQVTAQKFNRASTPDAIKSREAYRGRTNREAQTLSQGDADRVNSRKDISSRTAPARKSQPKTRDTRSAGSSNRGSAFQGMDRGSSERNYSSRGNASRQSMSRPSGGGGGGRR